VVLCFIVFLCVSPSSELVVFDPGKWLYRTRSEGLTGYSCLSVLLPLRVRLGHLSWNNLGGCATTALSPRRVVPSSLLFSQCAHSSVPACHRHSPSPVAYKRTARSSFLARTTPLPLPSLSSPHRPPRARVVPASWAGWTTRPCSPACASKLTGPEPP
jgi:hypothetical protein